MKKVLVTGGLGQIGTELVLKLRENLGLENVIATDIKKDEIISKKGIFEILDVRNYDKILKLSKKYKIDTIIHLASLLSATAEKNPKFAWELNMGGLFNTLDVAKELKLKYFTPSSIGTFGPTTQKINTPQLTIQRPTGIYGITKMAGELICDYYYKKYNVDARSVRFPGLISWKTPPGGGTTDYAVDIFYQAIEKNFYESYIDKNTKMDMMYIDDAIQAIIDLMNADSKKLNENHRNAYNVSAMSFSPKEIAKAIAKQKLNFKIFYKIDPVRQSLAESWPDSINSDCARKEWNFNPKYNLDALVKEMLEKIKINK